jgi:hypothetical protein
VPVLALPEIVVIPSRFLPGLPCWANKYWSLAVTAIPVSIGVAILRYRLHDIDLLIDRTLVYGEMTAAIVGFYVLVVGYLGLLFQARGEVASLLAAGLAGVIFEPLRRRLQMAVDRLLYGQHDEPYVVLSPLGQRLEAALVPAAGSRGNSLITAVPERLPEERTLAHQCARCVASHNTHRGVGWGADTLGQNRAHH